MRKYAFLGVAGLLVACGGEMPEGSHGNPDPGVPEADLPMEEVESVTSALISTNPPWGSSVAVNAWVGRAEFDNMKTYVVYQKKGTNECYGIVLDHDQYLTESLTRIWLSDMHDYATVINSGSRYGFNCWGSTLYMSSLQFDPNGPPNSRIEVYGQGGNDILFCGGNHVGYCDAYGGDGNDNMVTYTAGTLSGGFGNDRLSAGASSLPSGPGINLYGGFGDDCLTGSNPIAVVIAYDGGGNYDKSTHFLGSNVEQLVSYCP